MQRKSFKYHSKCLNSLQGPMHRSLIHLLPDFLLLLEVLNILRLFIPRKL